MPCNTVRSSASDYIAALHRLEVVCLHKDFPCGAVCGNEAYKVTLCFPGSLQNATCVYSITQNYTFTPVGFSVPLVIQVPCTSGPIFQGGACKVLPGLLSIAFGPCNAGDDVPVATPENTRPVVDWLQFLGLGQIQVDFFGFFATRQTSSMI